MKQIISFSLYGDDPLYCEGAIANCELAKVIYPGWKCRFYFDASVPDHYVRQIEATGAEMVEVTTPALGPMYGRYWRMWIAADPTVDRFIVRDVDSRLNVREQVAVEAWIRSGKRFHIMRDRVHHRTRALGGMWGGVGGSFPDIRAMVDDWKQFDRVGQNDRFVSEALFPLMGSDYLCHDSAGYFTDGEPFPPHPHLSQTKFVGEKVPLNRQELDIWRNAGELEDEIFRCGEAKAELRNALMGARAAEASLAATLDSFSWKITSPLRRIRSAFRRRV